LEGKIAYFWWQAGLGGASGTAVFFFSLRMIEVREHKGMG